MQGFYAAYLTGTAGSSLGIFVFQDGRITGVDVGGMQYDGDYTIVESTSEIRANLKYTVPPGTQLITGAASGSAPINIEFELVLPEGFADGRVVTIKTPNGTLNAKFQLLRQLPE